VVERVSALLSAYGYWLMEENPKETMDALQSSCNAFAMHLDMR
jgi:hypothetical protein